MNLIYNYNEIGIFVTYNKYIYWFNGKRLEYWCKNHGFEIPKSNKIHLGDCVYDWKLCNGFFVTRKIDKYEISTQLPDKCAPLYGYQLISDQKSTLYFFGTQYNEKYCTIGKKWSTFSCTPHATRVYYYFFNDRFYHFIDKDLYIYNPIIDQWNMIPIDILFL